MHLSERQGTKGIVSQSALRARIHKHIRKCIYVLKYALSDEFNIDILSRCFVLISSLLMIATMPKNSDSAFISLEFPGVSLFMSSFNSETLLFFIDK